MAWPASAVDRRDHIFRRNDVPPLRIDRHGRADRQFGQPFQSQDAGAFFAQPLQCDTHFRCLAAESPFARNRLGVALGRTSWRPRRFFGQGARRGSVERRAGDQACDNQERSRGKRSRLTFLLSRLRLKLTIQETTITKDTQFARRNTYLFHPG